MEPDPATRLLAELAERDAVSTYRDKRFLEEFRRIVERNERAANKVLRWGIVTVVASTVAVLCAIVVLMAH